MTATRPGAHLAAGPGQVWLQVLPGEVRGFLYRGDRLDGLAIERDEATARAGDLYHGRVVRLDRRLSGAFVALGVGPDGLLPLNEAPSGLSEGQALTVRVVRAAVEDKGPRLAPALSQAAPEGPAPRLLRRGLGAVERLLADRPDAIHCDDTATLRALQAAGLPATLALGGFAADLCGRFDAEVEALLRPSVPLPGGGDLLVEPGRTLTAIDVNLGRATAGDAESAAMAVNLAAAAEAPRQLRLRALAGRVVIDFLALRDPAARRRVEAALKAGLQDDSETVKAIGWSRGGLYELTRRRVGPSLRDLLLQPAGDYGGWRKRPETLAFEALRAWALAARAAPAAPPALLLAPPLLDRLAGHPALAYLQERFGRPPRLLASEVEAFEIRPGEVP